MRIKSHWVVVVVVALAFWKVTATNPDSEGAAIAPLSASEMQAVTGGQELDPIDVVCTGGAPLADGFLLAVFGYDPIATMACVAYWMTTKISDWSDDLAGNVHYVLTTLAPGWYGGPIIRYYEEITVTASLPSDTDGADATGSTDASGFTDADFCGGAGCVCLSGADCVSGACEMNGDYGQCLEEA